MSDFQFFSFPACIEPAHQEPRHFSARINVYREIHGRLVKRLEGEGENLNIWNPEFLG